MKINSGGMTTIINAKRLNWRVLRWLIVLTLGIVSIVVIGLFFLNLKTEAAIPADAGVRFKQVSAGQYHTCAISFDNQAYCWGRNNYGQLGDGTRTDSSTMVAVTVSGALNGKTIKSISAGGEFTCAIASDNNAYCWGLNYYGQTGNDSTSWYHEEPVAVATSGDLNNKTVKSISAGSTHTCVIASDDQAYCWGVNSSGQLGNNSTASAVRAPVAVFKTGALNNKTVKSISSGYTHTCAIASDDNAYCWGANNYGQLGSNNTTSSSVPVAVFNTTGALANKTVKSISAGGGGNGSHTCAIASDNNAYCWGGNSYGQLGNSSTMGSNVPVAVTASGALANKTVVSISSGGIHSCVVASDNQAYCWGYNSSGQLGDNSTTQSSAPTAVNTEGVLNGVAISTVSTDDSHTCAFTSGNQIYCWGANNYGQLGDGSTGYYSLVAVSMNLPQSTMVNVDQSVSRLYQSSSTTTPGAPLGLTNASATLPGIADAFRVRLGITNMSAFSVGVQQVSSGGKHACAIASDNQAYCWGYNSRGQLGDGGSTSQSLVPVAVATSGALANKTIKSISAGDSHTCVVASDNQAYCWGQNSNGQVGNNATSMSVTEPTAVYTGGALSGKTIKSISAGGTHTCAIASDNNAYCWGKNSNGQVGNNATSMSVAEPTAVYTGGALNNKTVLSITAGNEHTCIVASDNNAYCWGRGRYGRLGHNLTSDSSAPVAVFKTGALNNKTVLSITAGKEHTCAIASDNNAYCWGRGYYGRLGHNLTSDSSVPVAVFKTGALNNKTVLSITIGSIGEHTCVTASDNNAYCWGYNNRGQLGNNNTTNQSAPAAVSTTVGAFIDKTVKSISGGESHTCAIASDNQVYCWGLGYYGQLGNNSNADSYVPTAVDNSGPLGGSAPTAISASAGKFQLEYAPQGVAISCGDISTGWTKVTNSSAISYDSTGPDDGTVISSFANDPTVPTGSTYSYQSIVRGTSSSPHTFTNNADIDAGETGLWDFALKDRTSRSNTNYCLRIVTDTAQSPGSSVDTHSEHPQLTTATGSLGLRFVDNNNTIITNPSTNMAGATVTPSTQTTTGYLTNSTTQQLEIFNSLSSTGWSVSLAATGGATAVWQKEGGGASYPYNHVTANNGQLSVNLSSATAVANGTTPGGTTCNTTGLTFGSNASFVSGTTNIITLANAGSNSGFNCSFKLRNINLSQIIPANQTEGTYKLNVTATVVAQ